MGIDYYGVLSLKRTCRDLDIKRAYRRLVLNFHPDRLKDDANVHQVFSLISEAYEVLVNPLSRAVFDQYGEEGLKTGVPIGDGDFFPAYVYHGQPLKTYREFFGTESPYADLLDCLNNPLPIYDTPEGRGIRRKAKPIVHPLRLTLEEIYFGGIKKMKIQRHVFKDETQTVTDMQEKILNIPIKPGVPENTEIIFREEGDQSPTTIPADIIFVTEDRPHPVFKRVGNDLVMTQVVSLIEGLIGFTVRVRTLDEREFLVPITDIVTFEYEKVVPNEGMWIVGTEEKGNLVIKFEIVYPKELSARCKEMLRLAFECVESDGGSVSAEEVNSMVMHNKMNRNKESNKKPQEKK